MEVKTQMLGDDIEVQFTDGFTVADHNAVQQIVASLVKLRSDHQIIIKGETNRG